jgi:hypothetical protein
VSLTVASISSDSSIDVRQVLLPTDTKFAGWIDRINKDCMHSSVYRYLNLGTNSFTTVPGQGGYSLLGNSSVRRIVGVQDLTRNRILFPVERATSPVSQLEQQEPNPGQQGSSALQFGAPLVSPISMQAGQPGYFRHVGSFLNLIPIPTAALLIGYSFELQVATLINPTDILPIPEDGRDMVVAGVNYLANIFLKRMDEAQIWAQIYESLKQGKSLV